MAEYTSIKLNPEQQLLLEQPLLRLPYELSRNNFKTAQISIDQTQKKALELVNGAVKASTSGDDPASSAAAAAGSLDQAISRLNNLKRKLTALNETSKNHTEHLAQRLEHLDKLYAIESLADVKYEEWSRVRLDRLLVDYMLRNGYTQSARELAKEKNIEKLVDVEEFEAVGRIERSLREGRKVDAALAWCAENKQGLKKINSIFELDLRLQQFIELARTGSTPKMLEAVMHARKYLATDHLGLEDPGDDGPIIGRAAAGLLAFPPDTKFEPYASLWSEDRWLRLAATFVQTHHTLFTLSQTPLLTIALSAGLSALKTPACHSKYVSPSSGLKSGASPAHGRDSDDADEDIAMSMSIDSIAALEASDASQQIGACLSTSVCPICSTELNKLAKNVPYAHHSKSHVESDPLVLPNGRVYGRDRLERTNEKLGAPPGMVRDPMEPTILYEWSEVRKVFIS